MKESICRRCSLEMWLIFLLVFPGFSKAVQGEEKPRLPVGMEVVLKTPQPQLYELHIHLTNLDDEPVQVDVRDLPWNPTEGQSWLSGIWLDSKQTSMRQDYPRGHFGSRMVRLLPGESIQERIPLKGRFPTLLDDVRDHGVQLRWDCPPLGLKFVCQPGVSNTLSIPKGDAGLPDTYTVDREACRQMERDIDLIEIPQGHDVLFLLASQDLMRDDKTLKGLLLRAGRYVEQCHPTWTNSWAVSFFTDKKFAGFLNEERNTRYFEQGLWQEANVGQYSSQIRTLFRFPWIKQKSDSVYISIYELRQHSERL